MALYLSPAAGATHGGTRERPRHPTRHKTRPGLRYASSSTFLISLTMTEGAIASSPSRVVRNAMHCTPLRASRGTQGSDGVSRIIILQICQLRYPCAPVLHGIVRCGAPHWSGTHASVPSANQPSQSIDCYCYDCSTSVWDHCVPRHLQIFFAGQPKRWAPQDTMRILAHPAIHKS